MKKVSFEVLEAVLAPICSPQEPQHSELIAIDGNDERNVRRIIQLYVKPYFESFDERSKAIITDSLLYCLSASGFPVDRLFLSGEIPFDPPEQIMNFYRWLAEELLGDASEVCTDHYQVVTGVGLAHQLKRRR